MVILNTIRKYTFIGFCFGIFFPFVSTILVCALEGISILEAQIYSKNYLLWIIDTAPFVLGFAAFLLGKKQESLDKSKSEEFSRRSQEMIDDLIYIKFALDKIAIIAETTPSGIIISVNQKFTEISGYTADELIGSNHRIVNSGYHSQDFFTEMWSTILSGKIWRGEIKNRRKDGTHYWVDTMIIPRTNYKGRLTSFTSIRVDITERKEFETKLIEAKELAQSSSNAKSQFLASMGHEIRTPLSGIIGMIEILEDSDLKKDQLELTQSIHTSARSLLTILSDVLDFSKIEAGKMTLEKTNVNPNKVLEEVHYFFKTIAKEKNIKFNYFKETDIPIAIESDEVRFRQILTNLISNAIKFTEEGEVSIIAKSAPQPNGKVQLQISIEDTGIGIPREKIRTIFVPFTQVDASTTRLYGGTGLGLSICRELSNAMNGDIFVRSEVGKGSKFTFTAIFNIPRQNDSDNFIPLKHYPKYSKVAALKILVVDDNEVNRKLCQTMIKSFGYHSDLAINGEEALNLLEKNKYDLIFMDIQMPIMDGFEATRQIRIKYKTDALPFIIALTANAFEEDKQKCLNAGMNDFLPKPISKLVLAKVFENLLTGLGYDLSEISSPDRSA